MLAQVQFVLHGWLSQESKGGVQQNWRRQELSLLNGCILWGARVVVPPPGKERVIQELREIHVHSGIAKIKLGKKLCVVGEPGCRPGAEVRTYTKCQSSRPPELVLCPDRFTCVRKRVSCSLIPRPLPDLSCSCGEKSGEGLVPILRHGRKWWTWLVCNVDSVW